MIDPRARSGVHAARAGTARVTPLACALLACLLPASAAFGAVFTVGPGGSHATVQAALNTAVQTAGDDEVRIAVGTYPEALAALVLADERLDVSGGRNATFDARTEDPTLTVIDASNTGRALRAEAYAGVIAFQNLTLTRGAANYAAGAGLSARSVGEVSLSDCVVSHSVTLSTNAGAAEVGGVGTAAYGDGRITLSRCHVHSNRVEAQQSFARAGGVQVYAGDNAHVRVADNLISGNAAVGAMDGFAGGLEGFVYVNGRAEIVDNTITGNSAGIVGGVNLFLYPGSTDAQLVFQRNQVVGNLSSSSTATFQMQVSGDGPGHLLVADSLVADGIGSGGLTASAYEAGTVSLVNNTLAGNEDADLQSVGGINISNTLADVTHLFSATDVLQNNRFDSDPGYVDRAGGDYRLALTSPAIGAGTLTPPGGLGLTDLDGNTRVRGIGVDIGAYEADDPRLLIDSFE